MDDAEPTFRQGDDREDRDETRFPDPGATGAGDDPEAAWGITVELVRRYKDGDRPALDLIFDRYYERVFRILRIEFRGNTWLEPRIDVDDIVQETFKKAFEIFDRFEMKEPASLVRWLVKIAKNRIGDERDRHRAGVRDMRREVALAPPPGDARSSFDLRASTTLPPEVLQRAEELQIVDDCVAELEGDWKEIILLRDYEGGSWAYVAETMGRSIGAVEMLHRRARVKLAQRVGQRLRSDEA